MRHTTRVIFLLAAVVASFCCPRVSNGAPQSLGDHAPDITMTEFGTDNPVSLHDFEGSIVLLDFFSPLCGHCHNAASELRPEIEDYYEQLGGNPSGIPVRLVALALNPTHVQEFIDTHQLTTVLDDLQYSVFGVYGEGYIPHLTIINGAENANYQQWEILYNEAGYAFGGYSGLRETIDRIAAVPEPSALLLSIIALSLVGGWRKWGTLGSPMN